MSSAFGGIEIGKRALQTQQRSLEVVGHNVANASNEKYSRQRAIQSATRPYTVASLYNSPNAGQVGTGVYVKGIERMRDQFIDTRIRYENHALGKWSVLQENLREIESIFNELDEGGLTSTLNEFWSSFDKLSNNPESLAVRESIVQKSINLTTQMNHINDALLDYRDHIGSEIEGKIIKVNDLTKKIASLNSQIKAIESDVNKSANDLADERDDLLDQLSKLVDCQVRFDNYNQANVNLNGINLVQAGRAKEIEISIEDQKLTVDIDSDDDLSDDTNYTYQFDKYNFKVGNNSVEILSGEIRGLMEVRDAIIDHKVNKLDKLAQKLKNEVNNLHKNGFGLDGSTGLDFFTFNPAGEFDAGHLEVNQDIVSAPDKIAASTDPDIENEGNGENALSIYRLRFKAGTVNSTTFEDFWQTQSGRLGIEIERAGRMESNQNVLVDQLGEKREEISGVSFDEELTEMVKFQHGYNAAAQVIAKVDQMLDTLINGII